MTERPILFSEPMVRAILAGRKTQTRRVVHMDDNGDPRFPCHIGDRLWVREAWRTLVAYEDLAPRDMSGEEPIRYEADGYIERWGHLSCAIERTGRRRQGMHMPRWASRLILGVQDVRVEQLDEITEDDAKAEGCNGRASFRGLWDELNGSRGCGVETNPWVAAISFSVEDTPC